jgi:hypothetical protein
VTNSGPSLREARVGDGGGDGPTQPPSSQHKRETCPSRRSTGRGRGSDRCATKAADHRAAYRVAGGRSDRSAAASTYGAARHRSLARASPQAVVIAKANPIAMVARVAVRDMWSLDP